MSHQVYIMILLSHKRDLGSSMPTWIMCFDKAVKRLLRPECELLVEILSRST